jgi:hypothetical protein
MQRTFCGSKTASVESSESTCALDASSKRSTKSVMPSAEPASACAISEMPMLAVMPETPAASKA